MTESTHDLLSLHETMKRFDSADQPDVITRWVRWPEMAKFTATLRDLRRATEQFAHSDSVQVDLQRWTTARNILRSSFVAPSHASIGLADESDWGPLATGELGAMQEVTRAAVRELALSAHRGLEALEEFFGPSPKLSWPVPGVARVVVPTRAIDGTQEALASVAPSIVDWEVCSFTEARRRPSCDVTVVPGSPEFHESWHTEPAVRPRIVGWVFNAPMSPHIVSLRWAGSRPFESDPYEPYRSSTVFDARSWSDPIDDVVEVEDEPPIAQPSPRPSSVSSTAPEAVLALDFQLPGRYWISFGVEDGPRASRIDDDGEFELRVKSDLRATKLRRGDTLVIVSPEQERDLRNELCRQWLKGEKSRPSFEVASATVAAYKSAIRRFLGTDEGIAKMVKQGFTETYLRSQFARSSRTSWAMAPRNKSTFEALARAADWEPPDTAWDHVSALRAGFGSAGREIASRLRAAVTLDLSWTEIVDQREIAHLEVEGVGYITLAPILSVADEPVTREVGQLGVMVKT